MKEMEFVSIRGRMAYLLCSFEKLLIYYKCNKADWSWILERMWKYTSISCFDDWIYEIAEFLPDNIMQDGIEAFEYITKEEYQRLKRIYSQNSDIINRFINIIYELGTEESYSRLINYSPNTLKKLQEGMDIITAQGIEKVSSEMFKRYSYSEYNGWGTPFDGKELSVFLK